MRFSSHCIFCDIRGRAGNGGGTVLSPVYLVPPCVPDGRAVVSLTVFCGIRGRSYIYTAISRFSCRTPFYISRDCFSATAPYFHSFFCGLWGLKSRCRVMP